MHAYAITVIQNLLHNKTLKHNRTYECHLIIKAAIAKALLLCRYVCKCWMQLVATHDEWGFFKHQRIKMYSFCAFFSISSQRGSRAYLFSWLSKRDLQLSTVHINLFHFTDQVPNTFFYKFMQTLYLAMLSLGCMSDIVTSLVK